jgi:hypothetical protein
MQGCAELQRLRIHNSVYSEWTEIDERYADMELCTKEEPSETPSAGTYIRPSPSPRPRGTTTQNEIEGNTEEISQVIERKGLENNH